jgi:gluconolactonase
MTSRTIAAVALGSAVLGASVFAQSPSSAHPRGNSQQAWQNPGLPAVLAKCKVKPAPFGIQISKEPQPATPPPDPAVPPTTAIPNVIAAGQTWKTVWDWQGNNADGPIAGDGGALLFANNDANNVMRMDPKTGLATVVHRDVNTGGAVSRSKNGSLFMVSRGLNSGVVQLEPTRKVLATTYNGEPFECVGGVLNDLSADSRGGVYVSITGAGVFYVNPQGTVSQFGQGGLQGANGIILSPDEKTLYVTNGAVVVAFDVRPDGSLANLREFGKLRGGTGGDGSAVDEQGRLYVSTQTSVDVFGPDGAFLGTIPGIPGLHGVAFGGPDKKTLYAIVFTGAWGTSSARNRVMGIPTLARGYTGRAK